MRNPNKGLAVMSLVVALGLAGCDGLIDVDVTNRYEAAPVASPTVVIQNPPQNNPPVDPPQVAPIISPSINFAPYNVLNGYFPEGAREASALSVAIGNSNDEPIRNEQMMLTIESAIPGGRVPNCEFVRLIIRGDQDMVVPFGSNHTATFDLQSQAAGFTDVPAGLKREYDFAVDVHLLQPNEGFILRLNTVEWSTVYSGFSDTARPNLAGYPQYAPTPSPPPPAWLPDLTVTKNVAMSPNELVPGIMGSTVWIDLTAGSRVQLATNLYGIRIRLLTNPISAFIAQAQLLDTGYGSRGLTVGPFMQDPSGVYETIVWLANGWTIDPGATLTLGVMIDTREFTTPGNGIEIEVAQVARDTIGGPITVDARNVGNTIFKR